MGRSRTLAYRVALCGVLAGAALWAAPAASAVGVLPWVSVAAVAPSTPEPEPSGSASSSSSDSEPEPASEPSGGSFEPSSETSLAPSTTPCPSPDSASSGSSRGWWDSAPLVSPACWDDPASSGPAILAELAALRASVVLGLGLTVMGLWALVLMLWRR